MEEQGHTCTEKTLLIKLMSRMSVDSHLHTHTHTLIMSSLNQVLSQCCPPITELASVSLHSWSDTISTVDTSLRDGGRGSLLLPCNRSRRAQFPGRRHHQGECCIFFFFLDCWNLTKRCMSAWLYICVYRWQKWRTILAGSQQKSRGSVATYHRTTFPSSLIRKTFD